MQRIKPKFRSDINGLRAWAVILVILYHFNVPGFTAGFVGVDVFFVISGFLMTGIIIKGLEQNRFSFLEFYIARARRILPALLVLCAILLMFGWVALLPIDYKNLGIHSITSIGFFSNIRYWSEAGYFDSASHEKWLLHTWSLSVEWQFYILLPIILKLSWKIRPHHGLQKITIIFGILISLSASILITNSEANKAFYWLHTRAWEMLCGGIIFLTSDQLSLKSRIRQWLPHVGILLIIVSSMTFNSQTAWPSYNALLPVLAATIIIAANTPSILTGNKIAQWLGDRSYSLYLWHWPIYVSLVYSGIQHNTVAIIAGLSFTLLISNLSYKWIETPARRSMEGLSKSRSMAAFAASISALALPAYAIKDQGGFKSRFSPEVEVAASEAENINRRRDECHAKEGLESPSCVYGGKTIGAIAIGDSHLSATITSIAEARPNKNIGVIEWSYSACPPVSRMSPTPTRAIRIGKKWQCQKFTEWTHSRLSTIPGDIPIVILGRYAWAAMSYNENNTVQEKPEIYFSKVYQSTTPQFLDEFSQHIINDACKLAKQRKVYLVRPIPELGIDAPKTLSRRIAWGLKDDISIPLEDYFRRNSWVWVAQNKAKDQCGVRILDPTRYLCDNNRCYGSKSGRPLYADDDHLSEFGNKILTPMFTEVYKR